MKSAILSEPINMDIHDANTIQIIPISYKALLEIESALL